MMFDAESYVARPPAIIAPPQRLALQAITFSMKAAMAALSSIQQITGEHTELTTDSEGNITLNDFDGAKKVTLFSNAWEIVDQTHVICKLLEAMVPAAAEGTAGQTASSLSEGRSPSRLRRLPEK
jgi:hypothetical protein